MQMVLMYMPFIEFVIYTKTCSIRARAFDIVRFEAFCLSVQLESACCFFMDFVLQVAPVDAFFLVDVSSVSVELLASITFVDHHLKLL